MLTAGSVVFAPLPVVAMVKKNSAADEMSKQAVALFAASKFQDAIDLERQAIKKAPNYWLPHSALSIFDWQQNQFEEAVLEAEQAAKLAPDNELANLNYAQMNQLLGYYERAIPAFKKTVKIAPNSWSPRVGLSQSLIANAQASDALQVLNEMSKAKEGSFNWWYNLAVSYSKLDKPKASADAAEKAVSAAANSEQKSRAYITLLIELIRANEIERARAVQQAALSSKPKNDQVYVQVMSALCSPEETNRGRELLDLIIQNGLSSADGLYRLGCVLEKKSTAPKLDPSISNTWLDLALTAYKQAIKLAPTNAKLYLALAAVLDQKGDTGEMVTMLSKAGSIDAGDGLPSYLVSCVKTSENDLVGRLRDKLVGAPQKPYQLNLLKEDFSVENLKCTCKLGVLEFELKRQDGIKFVAITHREKPIRGALLVDKSVGTEKAFKQVGKTQSVDLAVVDSEPILTVNQAIKFVQNLRDTAQPTNTWSFEIDSPKMPLL